MRRLFAAASLLLCTGTASAQSSESVAKEFGLLGTWAANCAQPPSKANIHSSYAVKDGQVLNTHDAGPEFREDVFVVRAAKPTGIDLVLIQSVSRAGQVSAITLRRIGDKIQIWRVVAADNKVPVADGKFTVNDAVIPALSRCK